MQNTSKITQILRENLTGADRMHISCNLKFSMSKVEKYLAGKGSSSEDLDLILNEAFIYFCDKYKKLLMDINEAKYLRKANVDVMLFENIKALNED